MTDHEPTPEMTIASISFGEVVSIVCAFPNGVKANVVWELDAHDKDVVQRLADEYEEKIREKLSGRGQDFKLTKPEF